MQYTVTNISQYPTVVVEYTFKGDPTTYTVALSLTGVWALPADPTADDLDAVLTAYGEAHAWGLEQAALPAAPAVLQAATGVAKVVADPDPIPAPSPPVGIVGPV